MRELSLLNDPVIEEMIGLFWGALGFLTLSYALSRALRAAQHGFSIRLQLFFTLFFASMITTTLIGVWSLQRVEAKAALLFEQHGLSAAVLEEFVRGFGAKTGLILGVLALICAGSALALGRGLASPVEHFADAAEGVSAGAEISSLPEPSGREMRRLRNALVTMHEALEDRRQFERFIADLSHDLKNPVAAIQASVEVLQSGAGDDPQARALFLSRVDESSARLNRILSDFLGIARLEARGVRFDPHPFPIHSPIYTSLNSVRGIAEARSVIVHLTDHSEAPAEQALISGSSRWLTRALDNLLSNAIRHTPSGGQVWIDWTVKSETSFIVVSDEGPGVPLELRADIFSRFITHPHPASREAKIRAEGTGLGLAIVKRIVEAHQGSVWLLEPEAESITPRPHHPSTARLAAYTAALPQELNRDVSGAQFVLAIPCLTGPSEDRSSL